VRARKLDDSFGFHWGAHPGARPALHFLGVRKGSVKLREATTYLPAFLAVLDDPGDERAVFGDRLPPAIRPLELLCAGAVDENRLTLLGGRRQLGHAIEYSDGPARSRRGLRSHHIGAQAD
jgi:hypothetical protein